MRNLAILTFVTLDGVMQAPVMAEEDMSGGFDQGGWAAPYWDGVMPEVERTAMYAPYDMLFGRITYDIFAGHWPTAPRSALSERMNAARKHVVTSRSKPLTWTNSQAITGDIAGEIRALKAQNGPLLQVHGSAQLIQLLLAQDLIDIFRLWTFPVIAGRGKRLFSGKYPPIGVTLTAQLTLANGVVMQTYTRQSEAPRRIGEVGAFSV